MLKHHQTKLQRKLTDTRYGKMIIPSEDDCIGRSLDLYGEYCQPEVEMIKSLTNANTWFLDIGANIGTHTIPLSHHVDRVLAFEPDVENYDMLGKNVAGLCAVKNNVSLTRLALGDEFKQVDTEFNYGKTKIIQGDAVKMAPLDILGLPKIDFVKIDVEGMELQVLVGMRNTLLNSKPDLLIEMQDETTYSATFEFLRSCKYNMYWFPVQTYNANNHKENKEDVFGPTHGVVNWVCSSYMLNTAMHPVVDKDDTMERMVYRSRENVGNDRKDGE